ncbi:hypothetical protein ACFY8P_32465 [Streptomyces sp. NPDC012693]|jgi:hypothetical protein|uniref:hypothetical protein n=1 Tax=unclassified Streptomyces TaxID=2593676 RepID=UPI002030D1AC|nr:hypothetical protein [Streptomyces sp. MSC1_001]
MLFPDSPERFSSAIYLRSFHFDEWAMAGHRDALQHYARSVSLAEGAVFLDNGCMSADAKPRLERLMDCVSAGIFQVVLVPGPWVFSIDDTEARAVVARIEGLGCRVVEMPSPRHASRGESAEQARLVAGDPDSAPVGAVSAPQRPRW